MIFENRKRKGLGVTMTPVTSNVNIMSEGTFPSPIQLRREIPASDSALQNVDRSRATIQRIICRQEQKKVLVWGMCALRGKEDVLKFVDGFQEVSDEFG